MSMECSAREYKSTRASNVEKWIIIQENPKEITVVIQAIKDHISKSIHDFKFASFFHILVENYKPTWNFET